ncbi:hypothetical protein E5288_WYG012712 [Bos mutus]|uniref:Uncharacterized protein n=1 Tax=Bos mutus TaxID=72004 RepID=A0A6B0QZC1_9CETA|nr:hypothetical protein [Bos mutus]
MGETRSRAHRTVTETKKGMALVGGRLKGRGCLRGSSLGVNAPHLPRPPREESHTRRTWGTDKMRIILASVCLST